MALIKNAILLPIQRLIGIAPSGSPTVLDDDSVSLTFPVIPDIARRSLSSLPTGGYFMGILENVHSGADDEASSIDPYNAGVDAVPPYPAMVSSEFDLWLLGISGRRSSGAGGLTGAIGSFTTPQHVQGWGRDDVGAPLVTNGRIMVAQFDGISTIVNAFTTPPMITEQGILYQPVGIRMVRGCTIGFHSTSAAAAEFQMFFMLGLFPAGLGQDVVT